MKKRIFAIVAGSLFTFSGFAQDVVPCGTDEALESLHQQFPQLKQEYLANQELLKNSLQVQTVVENGVAKKKATYVIPVVFHILHEYGSENIPDSRVYTLMEELNEDYSATNADLSQVIPMFDTIIGDAEVEFRLAALDPLGNCTNGIEHIYTHETNFGESVSKINQWNRGRYMNIWVVKTPNSGGTVQGTLLGYATFPASTDGSGFWTDGIVLRDYTVNSGDRTLSHEAGHYLGLAHPFNGVQNIGGAGECGDDGVVDTPPTEGSFSNCNLALPTCDTNVAEVPLANVQNIMDYSSCAVMFTEDQASIMNNTLEGIAGQRQNLWQDSTLEATGVDNLMMPQDPSDELTVPLCAPVADFFTPDGVCNTDGSAVCTRTAALGSAVRFEDASWNALIDSYEWTFEDATPATSTSANPIVSFDAPGWKEVSLTVTNAAGSDTRTDSKYIYISPNWAENNGPTMFDMETEVAPGTGNYLFLVENVEENYGKFKVDNTVGYNSNSSWKLQTYFDNSQSDAYTDDWFYNFRLGGSIDRLITPSINLAYTTGVEVTFKYAYATNATVTSDITEELKVYATRNSGESWTPRILSVDGSTAGSAITGDDLVTAGYASNADFAPSSDIQWREGSFTYSPNSSDNRTRFMFEFRASDLASNIYIDDINVTGVLNLQEAGLEGLDLQVYPNPSAGEPINVSYMAQDEPVEFTLLDAQGKVIATQVINTTNGQVTTQLANTANLPSALYFLEVTSGENSTTRKVVVM
ncbi:MAG: hypothetical protein Crog4KO_11190 [Crocinitomicaceae bacterium]